MPPSPAERVVDGSPDGLLAYDASGRCELCNPAMSRLLGRPVADCVGRPVAEILGRTPESARRVRLGERHVDLDVVPVGGGGLVVARAPCGPEPDDVARLREEREQLLVTLRSIADGVIVTDAEGRVTLMNAAAEEYTGWGLDEAGGMPIDDIFSTVEEVTGGPGERPVAEVLATRRHRGLHDHMLLVNRDGHHLPVAHSAAPILLRAELLGVVLVFRDMRPRRKLEQELLRSSRLEAVATFSGGVAHDFNNLLTVIFGSLTILERHVSPTGRARRSLDSAASACRRAQDLTRQLSTLARGGSPVRDRVDLHRELPHAAQVAARDLGGCDIRVELPPDLWSIEADAGQVRHAVQNLLHNAAQASGPGDVILVSAGNEELEQAVTMPFEAGRYVKITVRDYGVGIDGSDISRIFDPFYTTKPNAVGLGLATVHTIVHAHGGYVTVESTVGEGTAFHLWFPASDGHVDERVPAASVPTVAVTTRRRILLMDDEALLRDTVREILEELGFDVAATADGAEAVDAYREAMRSGRRFDAVIMDLTVPGGMGGAEAMRHLRELDPTVTAIVSSGYSDDPVMANHQKHGFAAVLPKPYGFAEIARCIEDVLGQRPPEDDA